MPAMEARIVSLPIASPPPARVRVDDGRIVVEHLEVDDPQLAAYLDERDAAERPSLLQRAIRIGLLALQDANVTVDADVVRTDAGPQRSTAGAWRGFLRLPVLILHGEHRLCRGRAA